ncbi:sugar transporter [Tardiphaga robiniae]|uniref:Sugar transporter n=1 Tax=Tardiphaga robiniae TaxID=943830 RepID=A0A7G6TUL0_9BRAD|nr:sugar transporter [Tardiphaga robiniae]QND70442.1 sugar transporter [Tardiphaga robiniae]
MLKKVEFDHFDSEELAGGDSSHLLRPDYYWQLVKRRWLYFLVPFLLLASAGTAAAWLWPATYLSEGKILVQSQQIPTELVRPTVTNSAQERIQVIEQRTMSRDNLIAIVDKFRLFPQKRDFMSPTELVAEVRKSAKITAVDQTLDFKQRSRQENPTIVFSVGFEYTDPRVAAQVANELVTRILSEDLRDRTSRANDTTKFLAREVDRLRAENEALDEKIARSKPVDPTRSTTVAPDQSATALGQLRVELAQKSALYSPKHPVIQLLNKQIEAMEKSPVQAPANAVPGAALAPIAVTTANREMLLSQQEALQKNLETATGKLAAARLGENLEKDQQSEKLEVIEQPTVPQQPIRPNRTRIAGMSLLAAFAAGLGLAFLLEFTDKSIRRTSDLFHLVDSRLLVGIPYIATASELAGRRRRSFVMLGLLCVCILIGVVAAYLLLPIDLIIAKARVGLFR